LIFFIIREYTLFLQSMKGINIFLAEGFEEIEALATCDILRRGGVEVKLVSISDSILVTGSHGITVKADTDLSQTQDGTAADDFMIFPGGMPGSVNLAGNLRLMQLAREHAACGGSLAAICAAPGVVLPEILDSFTGVEFTCYDGFEARPLALGGTYRPETTVVSRYSTSQGAQGCIITGNGPGAAMDFAYAILKVISQA